MSRESARFSVATLLFKPLQMHTKKKSRPQLFSIFTIGTPYGNNRNYLDYFYLPCFKLAVRSSKPCQSHKRVRMDSFQNCVTALSL
jgi:hypothetical protein